MSSSGEPLDVGASSGEAPENGADSQKNVLTDGELALSDGDGVKQRKLTTAKRLATRRSPSKDDSPAKAVLIKDKHQSRLGRGRGQPKKGGGGGKGTWGKPGSELFVTGETRDVNDPNYDSDAQGDGYVVETIAPQLSEQEAFDVLYDTFHEYFEHAEASEVIESLKELNLANYKHKIAEVAVNMALDRKATHRELTSVLLSEMYTNLLSQDEIAQSFVALLHDLADLTIDAPEAPVVVGQFIARAIADDCLPPKFIATSRDTITSAEAGAALDKADVLLNMKHGIVRLDTVWGLGGGIRPVKYLVRKMTLLLKEYLFSNDAAEAARCLVELEVPHFHHELVYEAVQLVIEDGKDRTAEQLCALLRSLAATCTVTGDQLSRGFVRVLEALPDISIDVPAAYSILEKFASRCYEAGFLPTSLLNELPGRGRKRYVSEGDGGRLKDINGHNSSF